MGISVMALGPGVIGIEGARVGTGGRPQGRILKGSRLYIYNILRL